MTIEKIGKAIIWNFLILILLIGCKKMNEENSFIIIGDQSVIDNMKINVESLRQGTNYPPYTESKIETALFNGEMPKLENNEGVWMYKVYFSYKNRQVGVLIFENVMQHANDHVDYLYVFKDKEQDNIYLKYVGRKSDIPKMHGFQSELGSASNEFIDKQIFATSQYKELFKDKFFKFYDPIKQEYKTDPLDLAFIDSYKKLPVELKKNYVIFPSDLKNMGLSDDELTFLLKSSK